MKLAGFYIGGAVGELITASWFLDQGEGIVAAMWYFAVAILLVSAAFRWRWHANRTAQARDYRRAKATASPADPIYAEPYDYPLLSTRSGGEIIRGWRTYILHDQDSRVLMGMANALWFTSTLTARCNRPTPLDMDQSMGEELAHRHLRYGLCSCGIYLLAGGVQRVFPRTFAAAQPMVYTTYASLSGNPAHHVRASYVYANCVAWGTVVEHDDGYRAEHVRIEQLFYTDEWTIPYLRENYPGVPLVSLAVQTPEEAAALMRQFQEGVFDFDVI